MPYKKRNWELEHQNIHNNPEKFFYTFGKVTLVSEDLFQTPKVYTNRVLLVQTVDKVYKWVHDNKILTKNKFEWAGVKVSGSSIFTGSVKVNDMSKTYFDKVTVPRTIDNLQLERRTRSSRYRILSAKPESDDLPALKTKVVDVEKKIANMNKPGGGTKSKNHTRSFE